MRNWDSDSTRAQFDQLRQVPPLDPGFLLEMLARVGLETASTSTDYSKALSRTVWRSRM
jgi:hypothetical protein